MDLIVRLFLRLGVFFPAAPAPVPVRIRPRREAGPSSR